MAPLKTLRYLFARCRVAEQWVVREPGEDALDGMVLANSVPVSGLIAVRNLSKSTLSEFVISASSAEPESEAKTTEATHETHVFIVGVVCLANSLC